MVPAGLREAEGDCRMAPAGKRKKERRKDEKEKREQKEKPALARQRERTATAPAASPRASGGPCPSDGRALNPESASSVQARAPLPAGPALVPRPESGRRRGAASAPRGAAPGGGPSGRGVPGSLRPSLPGCPLLRGRRAPPALGLLSEETAPWAAVDSGSPGGAEFRLFLPGQHCHPAPEG